MSKTIVFKKEFESKLKELKIKTKFVNNIKDDCRMNGYSLQYRINQLNRYTTWYDFIDHAFCWYNTLEGKAYWEDIADL